MNYQFRSCFSFFAAIWNADTSTGTDGGRRGALIDPETLRQNNKTTEDHPKSSCFSSTYQSRTMARSRNIQPPTAAHVGVKATRQSRV